MGEGFVAAVVVVAAAPVAVAAAVAACEIVSRTVTCFPAEISASSFVVVDDAVAAGKDNAVLSGTAAVAVEKQPVVVFPASASEN